MAKFCMYCGAALAPGAKTCAACGRPVAQLPGFAPESGAAQGPRPDDAAREALTPAPPKAVFAAEGALAPAAGEKDAQTPPPQAAHAAAQGKDAVQAAAQNGAQEGPAAEKTAPGAPSDAPEKERAAAQPGEPAREEANAAPVPPAPPAPAPTPVPHRWLNTLPFACTKAVPVPMLATTMLSRPVRRMAPRPMASGSET